VAEATAFSEWTGIDFGVYSDGSIKVVDIMPLGPGGLCGQLAIGDSIVSVDGNKIVPVQNMHIILIMSCRLIDGSRTLWAIHISSGMHI
jgi:hypothetical protein